MRSEWPHIICFHLASAPPLASSFLPFLRLPYSILHFIFFVVLLYFFLYILLLFLLMFILLLIRLPDQSMHSTILSSCFNSPPIYAALYLPFLSILLLAAGASPRPHVPTTLQQLDAETFYRDGRRVYRTNLLESVVVSFFLEFDAIRLKGG